MKVFMGTAVAVLAAMVAMPTGVAGQVGTCPMTVRLFTSPKARPVTAGGKVVVTATVFNNNKKAALGTGGVVINVPPELCVQAASPRGAEIVPETGNVFWPNVSFKAGLGKAFKVKARVQSYYNASTANFSAYAYLPARACTSAIVSSQLVVVPLSGSSGSIAAARRYDGRGTCIVPSTANTTAGFALVGPKQRCLEAEITPLRRQMQEANERRKLVIGPNPTYPTAQECYEYCSLTEGMIPPFYFNLFESPEGNECACCQTCTAVWDPRWNTFLAVREAGTNAPTSTPTNAPTGLPTKSPTSAPSATPTSQPTATPTKQPTTMPTQQPTAPTASPTKVPTTPPTQMPTTASPTGAPTAVPSISAIFSTNGAIGTITNCTTLVGSTSGTCTDLTSFVLKGPRGMWQTGSKVLIAQSKAATGSEFDLAVCDYSAGAFSNCANTGAKFYPGVAVATIGSYAYYTVNQETIRVCDWDGSAATNCKQAWSFAPNYSDNGKAVDAYNGNLYVAVDSGNYIMKCIPGAAGVLASCTKQVTGLSYPAAVRIAPSGTKAYFSDYNSVRVCNVNATGDFNTCGTAYTKQQIISIYIEPTGTYAYLGEQYGYLYKCTIKPDGTFDPCVSGKASNGGLYYILNANG